MSLRPFLRGAGQVTVRERFSGRTWFDGEYAFDDSTARVRIVDARGRPHRPLWTSGRVPTGTRCGSPATFKTVNLYDLRQVLGIGGELAHRDESPVLYGRFLVHALEDRGRHNLWRLADLCLRHGGRFYLEFRTGQDKGAEHEFGEHFRKYLDPDTVIAEIEARGGHIEHREAGHGLAVYKNEDPHVCRLVATWTS